MFWPGRGEALDRTIEGERAITDLFAEALRRWAPAARVAVLPSLTAAALPPDPAAVSQTQAVWDQQSHTVIYTGLGILWAVAVYEATVGLGDQVADSVTPDVDTAVLGIVLASLLMKRDDVLAAVAHVESTPALKAARDEFLAAKQSDIAATPFRVQAKVEAALANLTQTVERTVPLAPAAPEGAVPGAPGAPASPAPEITVEVIPETRPEVLRAEAEHVLAADSPQMQQISTDAGYQAAGVMNHAVATVAAQSDDADELEKTWIATLDGKTRPTHWAADGQRVALAAHFTIGGEAMLYPGDEAASPAEWKNCRCRLGILGKDDPLPDEVDRHTERLDGRDSVVINRDGRTQAEEIERRADAGNIRARDSDDGIGRVAAAGWTAPSEQEYAMADGDNTEGELFRTFTNAVIALVGTPTSDGRMLASDIDLSMRDMPLPLMWCKQMSGGHYDAFTVGVIESATFADGKVTASGYLLNSEEADEAADQLAHGVTSPSVDLAAAEWQLTDTDGNPVSYDDLWDAEEAGESIDVCMTFTKAELIGTTLVATAAFGDTSLVLNAERESRDVLAASGSEQFRPRVYSAAMFADPQLSEPTPPTMSPDGRIFGHLACFGECHRSIQSQCVMAPRSKNGYGNFHTSPPLTLDNGERLAVGRLTVDTGHADERLGAGPAMAHYDSTGTCFALVRVGEDEHGVWFSGVAAPWATAEQIEMGLSAPLSGDWRDFGNGLELIAALAVNTPGFAVRGRDDSEGRPVALVASMGPARRARRGDAVLTHDRIVEIGKTFVDEMLRRQKLDADRTAVLARARDAVGDPPPEPTPTEVVSQLLARV